MIKLNIMNLAYGKNGCRYVIVKELANSINFKTLYVVSELPFFEDDNEMKLRADVNSCIAYKSYIDAVEDYNYRLMRECEINL